MLSKHKKFIEILNMEFFNFTMRILMRIISNKAILEGMNMQQSDASALYDLQAPKKPTNLSLNSDLLKKTRALNINLSATLEQALKEKLRAVEVKKWAEENKNAIKAYNDFVDQNGCFGDEFREF
ncbi:MAG: antitoxin CcdA [Phenylobacterium sp.]|jgi:antitoxin CcdA